MINAKVQQQQQQVDDKKATNANYNRKSQINLNLAYYSNSTNRNILSDNNFYVSRDYEAALVSQEKHILSSTQNSSTDFNSKAIGLLASDSTNTVNSLNEQISALFPKCRPKNDANLNRTATFTENNSTQFMPASNLLASSPSCGDYKNQNKSFVENENFGHTLIDNNRVHTRKMKNHDNLEICDRIQNNSIGIGETTSSRMNAANYLARTRNTNYQRNSQHQQKNDSHRCIGFESGNQISKMHSKWETLPNDIRKWPESGDFEREINFWEKRHRSPNTTPASTVLNSPDFGESHHYTHHPVQHQIKVGRSPVNQHEHNIDKINTSPDSPIQKTYQRTNKRAATLLTDVGVSAFDMDNWRNKNEKNNQAQAENDQKSLIQMNDVRHRFNHMLSDDEFDDERDCNSLNTDNVTKMIGNFMHHSDHNFFFHFHSYFLICNIIFTVPFSFTHNKKKESCQLQNMKDHHDDSEAIKTICHFININVHQM